MKENQEIQLFTVNANCEKHRCGTAGEATLTSLGTYFSFSLSLFQSELLCMLYFWNEASFPTNFRKPPSMAYSLHSLCLQFAGQKSANLQHRTLVLSRLWEVHFVQSVMMLMSLCVAEYLIWGTRVLSTLQNWASNEACVLHSFTKYITACLQSARHSEARHTVQPENNFETCMSCCDHCKAFPSREVDLLSSDF